ncbi:serine/threonine protein kinase [Phormidium sp. CCY1219]|uniref:serine/threonine protein kinase n=1 Tax=Phormidium sp. CCY1219 TaxID=2886104 RepID=UPI002D1F99B7|nr:serine/threonine-protein kinase [Phormidium sp. CCY1219]MEB3828129.1 serine/threonine protein kinase [Phormidium sp. CCY1219]
MSNFPDFAEYGYQVIRELGHNRAGGRVTYLAIKTGNTEGGCDVSPGGDRADPTHASIPQPDSRVAIKQFQFASTSGASWADYDAYQREIQVLQGLNHPGIPRYLDSFQTAGGFCIVQEYKPAESLAVSRPWTPTQIKQLAIALLDILVYLQNRIPPVIHRDIKPENILVDDSLNVYLIDFGFAHIGEGEVAMSSIVKGTLGFMPPEQLFNRELTPASDLYGVGATLIALLTGTKSIDIGNLIDANYRIHFQNRVKKISQSWVEWLETMVEPKPKNRYSDAATALEALKLVEVSRTPQVVSSHQIVQFRATELGEKLTQTIAIKNPVAGTMLRGRWGVASSDRDRPFTTKGHPWISISPARFKGNRVHCKITVDTSQLMAAKIYDRELLLHANTSQKLYRIALKLRTAPEPMEAIKLPYRLLAVLLSLAVATVWTWPVNFSSNFLVLAREGTIGGLLMVWLLLWGIISSVKGMAEHPAAAGSGAIAGGVSGSLVGATCALGFGIGGMTGVPAAREAAIASCMLGLLAGAYAGLGTELFVTKCYKQWNSSDMARTVAGAIAAGVAGAWPLFAATKSLTSGSAFFLLIIVGILTGTAAGSLVDEIDTQTRRKRVMRLRTKQKANRGKLSVPKYFSLALSLVTVAFGMSVGIGLQVGFWRHLFAFLPLLVTGIAWAQLVYPHWQRSRQVAEYHQSKSHRIQP